MPTKRSYFLAVSFLLVVCAQLRAQTPAPVTFFKVIQNDSVALFFNREFNFTEEDCHDYIRRVRVTEKGDFNGYFEDRSIEDLLLAKGVYVNGLKHGYFETYYPNGKLFSRGYYENNIPVGVWEYFYQTGLPERTLQMSDSTALVLRFVDPEGNVTIENGNGTFEGIVAGIVLTNDIPSFAESNNGTRSIGKIVNGKPEGKWIIPDQNKQAKYMEKYKNGKMFKSSLISRKELKRISVPPLLNTFFLGDYLTTLEGFELQRCSESQQFIFNRYPGDFKSFSQHLRKRINHLVETDIHAGRQGYYQYGDNYMSVKFSIDDKGKASNIELVSEWGERFLEVTKNAIHKTVFSNNNKVMYFHLRLGYAGGNRYRYTLRFSKRDRVR